MSSLFCVAVTLPVMAGTWTPDPSLGNTDQRRHLYEMARAYCDTNFDPDANLVGVPTQNPPNKKSHSVRESFSYAYALLLTVDPADNAIAQKILKAALATQDTREGSDTNGVFAWYAEDDWATKKNPDLNAAEFDGLTIAAICDMDRKHPMLDADLRSQLDAAGKLAVKAAMRRDVDPGYTNIALLSVALAAAGEKLWSVPGAGDFAQAKLDKVLSLAGDGDVSEYLSPTYHAVDIGGAYAALTYSFSDAFTKSANAMIDHLWKEIAASYHAPTYQLAGPFSRSYGDNMLAYSAALKYDLYLALDGAYPLANTDTDHAWDKAGLALLATTPITARPEFKEPTVPWRQFTAAGSDPTHPPRQLSQYRDGNFILGTVAIQDEWKQKRNLVAYWRNDGPPPDGFSVGYCLDESNETLPANASFGFIHFYCQQVKGAALVAMVTNRDLPSSGGSSLVFDSGASVGDPQSDGSVIIKDGTMTAYLYPISTSTGVYSPQVNPHDIHLDRAWSACDTLGNLHVLSYLIVFRPSNQSPPSVTGLALKTDEGGGSAAAQVDGDAFSVSFKN